MNPRQSQALRDLFQSRRIAALGTLHGGAPFVSMVPFAMLADASAFVINVSTLASHTGDMQSDPRVSLLVAAPETPESMPQALARVTIQAAAEQLAAGSPRHAQARDTYMARFPRAAEIAALPDFSFFAIRPVSLRFIPGFAQAMTLTPEGFAKALAAPQ